MKKKWLPVKEMIFTYLAINKILYWFNTITAMEQRNLGDVVELILVRLINHDFVIILGVIAFFFLDKMIEVKKSKYSSILENVIFYTVGYVGLMAVVFIYNLIMVMILTPQDFVFGNFMRAFIDFLPTGTLAYLSVVAVLNVKQYMKAKDNKSAEPLDTGQTVHNLPEDETTTETMSETEQGAVSVREK